MIKMQMISGLDIGNGYVKGLAGLVDKEATAIDFPSQVAYITETNDIKIAGSQVEPAIKDIFNEMDATFDSNLVKDNAHRFFGKKGMMSGAPAEFFDVSGHRSKSEQDLSGILVLGSLAGKALQEYYKAFEKLPDDALKLEVGIALALPITEFLAKRAAYAEKLKKQSHMVTIHNFEQPVRVEINFVDVQVLAEGSAAQYAITDKGEAFVASMLADCKKQIGDKSLDGITARDIMSATNTVGIDIGSGTVNIPVFRDGRFNADASMTRKMGFGTVLGNALKSLQEKNYAFGTITDLAELLQAPTTALNKNRQEIVRKVVEREKQTLAKQISLDFTNVVGRMGAFLEVIYVFGGGATQMKDTLYPVLLSTIRDEFGEGATIPVLYLDSTYSRLLNREGLYVVAKGVAKNWSKK